MEYSAWAPRYDEIRRTFGFPWDAEERSASRLAALLPGDAALDPLPELRRRLAGRPVGVVGLAPGAGAPPVWRLGAGYDRLAVVAADGAAEACLAARIVPEVVVTDLDGPVAAEVRANGLGAAVLVHAHGDNLAAIEEWVPQFPGKVYGSWAGPPRPRLANVGGFTDGDRAVYLAEHLGAREVLLWGFDFQRVEETDPIARARKQAKLAWAHRLIDEVARRGQVPVAWWGRDGTVGPYPFGGNGPATQ